MIELESAKVETTYRHKETGELFKVRKEKRWLTHLVLYLVYLRLKL